MQNLRKNDSSLEALQAETSVDQLLKEQSQNYRMEVDKFFQEHEKMKNICEIIQEMNERKIEILQLGQQQESVQNRHTVILQACIPLNKEKYKEFETQYDKFIEILNSNQKARFIFEVHRARKPFDPRIIEHNKPIHNPPEQGK